MEANLAGTAQWAATLEQSIETPCETRYNISYSGERIIFIKRKGGVMSEDLSKITKNSYGMYTWSCSMDVGYYRKGMWMGIKACLGIAAFILVFGVIMAVQYKDWTNFLIMAGSDAVFLLITFVVFKLALSAEDPDESYEMSDIYVKSGYGRSSVYFDFDKAKAAVFTPKYIELQNGIKKLRVFVPEEDYDFVKRYIMNRLTGECEIRYES